MKYLSAICGLIYLLVFFLPAYANDTRAQMQKIQAQVKQINQNTAHYTQVSKTLLGYSAEGAGLIAYYQNNQLQKLRLRFLGEMGYATEIYYFHHGKLIYLNRKTVYRQKPFRRPPQNIQVHKSQFYFNNGRLIVWLGHGGRKVAYKKNNYRQKSVVILRDLKAFEIAASLPEKSVHRDRILKKIKALQAPEKPSH